MDTPDSQPTPLHGTLLTPSKVAEWMTQIAIWADDGVSVEEAIKRMRESGLSLVQVSLLIQTYMALPDEPSV